MTKTEYRRLLDSLGMSQIGAARFLGVSPRTSRRYAAGEIAIEPIHQLVLRLLDIKNITPEKAYEITGLKIPKEGFGDNRVLED